MNNPIILKFLQEFINRLGAKNPTFFKVLSWIGGAASIIAGLPEFVTWLGVKNLPSWFTIFENKAVGIAGFVIFIMSNLTVNKDSIPEIKQAAKLPFTEKKDGL